ncbi:hypothetical protein UFOVP638_17 [uncultured Caudovirales phage]|jgi:hypothetical protein|uniref:Uncharacterized protein n=1 Tax=uncultured Caudovirales phage TaxID=2100421 RepID=A0A6J5N5I4_9CAUD|nr:hypothetical protein UFOVP638_17 [uncultured Caudovirales phage]
METKRGGARPNAGRKPVAEEQKVNSLFVTALKELYDKETDDDAKTHFIKSVLLESQRGQLFIAEHIFGKAPQEIKQTNFNIEAKDLDEEEIKKIKDTLENAY